MKRKGRKLSMKVKTLIGMSCVICFTLLSAGFGIYGQVVNERALTSVYEEQMYLKAQLDSISFELRDIAYRMLSFMSEQTPAPGNLNRLKESVPTIKRAWQTYLSKVDKSSKTPEVNKSIDKISKVLIGSDSFFKKLIEAYRKESRDDVFSLFEDDWPEIEFG
ncbi:MAG: hypothetical protein D6780_04640, partial [Candidatus Dadabacteria bacterium]